jgi:hypothetical protein
LVAAAQLPMAASAANNPASVTPASAGVQNESAE